MASSSSRSRAATRRSPRAAPRRQPPPPRPVERPVLATSAAVFGVLVAAEYLWLAWLVRDPEVATPWLIAVPVVLAVLALAGAALVVLGRARAWLLLAAVSVILVVCLLGTAVLFGALGLGAVVAETLVLLVGPLGCLVLAVRRLVREWNGVRGPARVPGGRRRGSAR